MSMIRSERALLNAPEYHSAAPPCKLSRNVREPVLISCSMQELRKRMCTLEYSVHQESVSQLTPFLLPVMFDDTYDTTLTCFVKQ